MEGRYAVGEFDVKRAEKFYARSAAVPAAGEAASSPPLMNAGGTPARQPARTPALRA